MDDADKKYYWLKLKRDFFKRHDIRIIEAMPNGKDYILFYLKLLCESVDHDGNLRFSEQIPYNEDMLATITNTNVDVVRSAIKVFTELQMMEILDDGTVFMREVQKMIGSETYWAEQKRKQREAEKLDNVQTLSISSPKCPSKSKSKSIDIDKDIYIGSSEPSKPKSSKFIPPTYEEVKAYCDERHNNIDPQKFIDTYTARGWMIGKTKMKDWRASVRTWEKNTYSSNDYIKPKNDYIQRDYSSSEYEDRQRKAVAGLEQALMDDFPNLD